MIAALYVRTDSVYKTLGIDCYDIERDARTFAGGVPVIAHPPCRAWGQLSHLAKPRPDEKQLAIDAIQTIRKNGGVLEHPRASKLWKELQLPVGGNIDQYGGFTICVNQSWWGHKAEKKTLLYICGCRPSEIPPFPLCFNAIEYTIASSYKKKHGAVKKQVPTCDRERTPLLFALWLVEVAKKCKK